MSATDTRPAPDLAALRTSLRVEVERVCHGAKWDVVAWPATRRVLVPSGGGAMLVQESVNGMVFWEDEPPDSTKDIGAAMALVDQLQAGWPGSSWIEFRNALDELGRHLSDDDDVSPWWILKRCRPALRPLVLTLAVFAARGAEWRKYLPLLTQE